MLAVGALLLTASGGYYAYAQFAKTGRDDLVHQVPRPTLSDGPSAPIASPAIPPSFGQSQAIEVVSTASISEPRVARETPETSSTSLQTKALDTPAFISGIYAISASDLPGTVQALMEASRIDQASVGEDSPNGTPGRGQVDVVAVPKDGRVSAAIDELNLLQARRPGGFEPEEQPAVEQIEIEPTAGTGPGVRIIPRNSDRDPTTSGDMTSELPESDFPRVTPTIPEPEFATRMIIPEIGLKAAIEELEVVEEDDSRAWETPKHVVGHIPTTAKPGISGQGWYFGHLESPISGEGNIFRRLPELAARFKRGEQFTIHLDAGNDRYVYQVYRTDVVHASEFAVSDSGKSDITLVSCWPQFEYSERVLVTAALVDIVEIPESERIQPSSG